MDPLDQLTDFDSLLEQVRHVKNDRNTSIQDQAEYFHKTLVDQIGSFSEIEEKQLTRYIKLSRENQDLQASYEQLADSLSQELRKVEEKNAELQEAKVALREAKKDCEAKEKYIGEAEAANAALRDKNHEQSSVIKSYKQKLKAMKEDLELRDKTIDDLQTSLRNQGALVDEYKHEIEQYRKQRKEWERQVDEAAQLLDDRSEVLKWLNQVSRPLKGDPKAPSSGASSSGSSSSEASSSSPRKLSDSVVGPTDDEEDDESHCATDSEKEDKATPATGPSSDRRLKLQSPMDCSSDVSSVDDTEPICGTTLDEEIMYLSDSLSALSIEEQASPTEQNMSHRREIPSPASSYDLDILPRRRKRRKQRTKEVEDSELARKRTKVRPHCESPVQTDSGETTSFDVQVPKQESPEGCASPVQTDSEANPSSDSGASDREPPETSCPIDCMKTAETTFTISRGVQTVADQMDRSLTIPSIEAREASGRSQPLLFNGRRSRYGDPVYLPKSYPKSQRLTHQARELGVSRPRYVSAIQPVFRSRVASWPLNLPEQQNLEQGDLQQESIETLLVSPSLSHGSESLEADTDDGPVQQTASQKHQPRSGYKPQTDGRSTPTLTGGKWLLRFVTVLLLSLFILSELCPDGERRSWDRANMMPHEPLTTLGNCPDSRLNVARAAEWEIFRMTDSEFLLLDD
ncbi:hypothetical protein CNMCM5793_000973 [Aspergillus hiratsukae]|uniref:Uncharacterized protein n=1 Tax=Aspergillus hiratsukae TaxID=1194566 RepID=A0A8H6UDV4_9EURO|nr:hypothetical protein CNMCM5793_000973 [Aspergillus hiratsukae]KAF7163539.1 hypothetical protein CNMCM6106_000443 [Aspergillus hiratsukae]